MKNKQARVNGGIPMTHAHEWINEISLSSPQKLLLFPITTINMLPFHVLSASHESRPYSVKTRTLSEVRLEGPQLLRTMRGQDTLIARAAYSAKIALSGSATPPPRAPLRAARPPMSSVFHLENALRDPRLGDLFFVTEP